MIADEWPKASVVMIAAVVMVIDHEQGKPS